MNVSEQSAEALRPTLIAQQLLEMLRVCSGREYETWLTRPQAPAPRRVKARLTPPSTLPPARYLLTWRGTYVQARGPSGQQRALSAQQFLSIFEGSRFGDLRPTGQLSDLGPLFDP